MSDHLGDTNKMVSDTPRTDEAEHFIDSDRGITCSGLARQLERELNAAQERINRLEEENDAMRADLLLWNEKEAK